jgi:hypothetical protein
VHLLESLVCSTSGRKSLDNTKLSLRKEGPKPRDAHQRVLDNINIPVVSRIWFPSELIAEGSGFDCREWRRRVAIEKEWKGGDEKTIMQFAAGYRCSHRGLGSAPPKIASCSLQVFKFNDDTPHEAWSLVAQLFSAVHTLWRPQSAGSKFRCMTIRRETGSCSRHARRRSQ